MMETDIPEAREPDFIYNTISGSSDLNLVCRFKILCKSERFGRVGTNDLVSVEITFVTSGKKYQIS
jgi:hypothetical protein